MSVFGLSACTVFGDVSVDIAPYGVIEKDGAFEIRHYERLVLVETEGPDKNGNLSSPFRRLFNYISGNNENAQEIAMTAPVFMDRGAETIDTMAFVLPADVSLETAPQPNDPAVKLKEMTDYRAAVIKFSGSLHNDNIGTHKSILQNWMKLRSLTATGPARTAGYNPPFTLPFMRRNEILIPIAQSN